VGDWHDTMRDPSPDLPRKDVRSNDFAGALCIGLVLVLMMATFYHYPFPSGERPDLFGFIFFWLRELLILVLLAVVLVVAGLERVWRRFRHLFTRGHDRP
jgi:multisubunit Na+/H+ antiporter MnhB subunit